MIYTILSKKVISLLLPFDTFQGKLKRDIQNNKSLNKMPVFKRTYLYDNLRNHYEKLVHDNINQIYKKPVQKKRKI